MIRNVLKKNGGKNAPHTLEKKKKKKKKKKTIVDLINQFFDPMIQNQFKGENGKKCESTQACNQSIIWPI